MAQAAKDEIKLIINSILIPHPKGMTVNRLLQEYAKVEYSHLPFRAMGYSSPHQMLSEMSDAVRYIKLPSPGDSIVQAIPDEQTAHISEMVANQKNSNNKVMKNITSLLRRPRLRPSTNNCYYQNVPQNSRSSYNGQVSSYIPKPNVTVNYSYYQNSYDTARIRYNNMSYSTYIILKLKELLRFYHSGVELRLVSDLFLKKFNQCIDLKKLDSDTVSEFLKKYPNVFQVWQKSGSVMVCLKDYNLPSSLLEPELSPHSEQRTLQLKSISFGDSKPKEKDVFTPNTVLKYVDVPLGFGQLEHFFIVITDVYSPGKFYWFLRKNLTAIESQTDYMTLFYNVGSNYYSISQEEVYIGQVVAARYSDCMWYRGRVVARHGALFEIFFLDYGSTLNIGIEQIRHLHVQFLKLPVQGMRGRIFGICPASKQQLEWSTESNIYFLSLVTGSEVTGGKAIAAATMKHEFAESDRMPVFALTLIDTNFEDDIRIGDCLVEKGLAQINSSDAVKIQEPTNSISQSQSPSPTIRFPQLEITKITVQEKKISSSVSTFIAHFNTLSTKTTPLKGQVKILEIQEPTNSLPGRPIGNITVRDEENQEPKKLILQSQSPSPADSLPQLEITKITVQEKKISSSVSTFISQFNTLSTPLKRQVKVLEIQEPQSPSSTNSLPRRAIGSFTVQHEEISTPVSTSMNGSMNTAPLKRQVSISDITVQDKEISTSVSTFISQFNTLSTPLKRQVKVLEIQEPTNLILQPQSPSPTISLPQLAVDSIAVQEKGISDSVSTFISHFNTLSTPLKRQVKVLEIQEPTTISLPQLAVDSIAVQETGISDSVSTLRNGSTNTAPLKRQVKALEMADGRKMHIIRLGEEMFLSAIETALFIPTCQTEANLERLKDQMKLAVECTVIHAQTTPNVFIECVMLDVPWIKDNEGDMIGQMTLYPLKVVSPLLFIFRATNKAVNQAINKQMKDVNDPYWR